MRGFNHEVKWFGIKEKAQRALLGGAPWPVQGRKKGLVVLRFEKNGRAPVPLIDHMINKSSLLTARHSVRNCSDLLSEQTGADSEFWIGIEICFHSRGDC